MKQRKPARDLLEELGVNPVQDLAQIAKQSKDDYDRIVESTEHVHNDMVRAEMLKVCNDSKKLHIQTLKELSNICAKEDDLGMKMKDHALRREEIEWKRAKVEEEKESKGKDSRVVYMPANLEIKKLPDGREVMVDNG